MNILLVNPFTGKIDVTPPLGLRYISGMLKDKGFHNVVGIDLHVDSRSRFESEVSKADIVGIHTVSKIFPEVVKLAEEAKRLNPKIKVVIGGPHASLCPEEVISAEPVDFTVVGEGEYTFLELIHALEKSGELSDIKGIWYKSNGIIQQNAPRNWIQNLDEVPFPDFELFDPCKYYSGLRLLIFRIGWSSPRGSTITASRSCPYVCTSCQPALKEIIGSHRQRSVGNVLLEIKFLMKKYKVRNFGFLDNTFTVNRRWVTEFCYEVIKQGLKIRWGCAGTISCVDKELLKLMKKAGCTNIAFGVESGSQYVLDNILHKRHSVEKAREVIRAASEINLRTHCWFMIGIPGETKKQTWETVELAKTIGCDSLMFSITQPQPHTTLEKTCKEKGWILPYQLSELEKPGIHPFSLFKADEWLGRSSVFQTGEWGPKFIEELKQKIVDDFDRTGWSRSGFTFTNIRKAADQRFLVYTRNQVVNFFRDFNFLHIKWALRAIRYKVKSLSGIKS